MRLSYTRKRLLSMMIFAALGVAAFAGVSMIISKPVYAAYYDNSDDKNQRCFDVQFTKQGNYTAAAASTTTVYKSNRICGQLNDDGVATKIWIEDNDYSGALVNEGHPRFELEYLGNNKTKITVVECSNGSNGACAAIIDWQSGDEVRNKSFTYNSGGSETFEEFVQKIYSYISGLNNDLTIAGFSDRPQEGVSATEEGDGEEEENKITQNCTNGGGAKSLGWIVCPIMTWMGEAAQNIYNEYVEPALQIEPQLFTGSNSNTLDGWSTFQNIANIIFGIMLLVVIFSQLTGVGISNYGIKKVLPKLIVTAILINLSYFLCVAAVDLSNILGNSLQALFDGLGAPLEPQLTVGNSNLKNTEVGGLVTVSAAAAMVGMVGTVWGNPAILLTLFISLVGVAISILMLFILLAAREAAVVVMVIISPMAVVCYALPNTKGLFNKWLNIMKALLILYPTAALLVGGGNYVSSLLMSSGLGNNFFTAITAMVAGIVPIFFIPSLTKSALAGLGNIGAKIGSFGDKMRGRATGAMTNSRLNQHLQNQGKMRQARLRAGVKYDKDGNAVSTRTGKLRNSLAGTKLGRAVGYDAALGTRKEQATANYNKQGDARKWNSDIRKVDTGETDGKGRKIEDTYVRDANGKWRSNSGKGENTLSDAEMRAKMENGQAQKLSYMQGKMNDATVERYKDVGATAASAGMGINADGSKNQQTSVDNVGRAAMRASGVAAQEATSDKLVAGQSDVLQVQHEKAAEKRLQTVIEGQEGHTAKSADAIRLDVKNSNNATEGANQAVAEAIGRASVGVNGPLSRDEAIANVAKSVEVNRQAAEKQFINVAAGNQAAGQTQMSGEQIQQAINTDVQKMQNQFTTEVAQNAAGVATITQSIADDRARAARVAQDRKIWSDQLSRSNSATVSAALASGLQNNDVAQVGAAFEILKDTGNLPAIHKALNNSDLWRNMTREMKLELNQDMIKSGDVGMKLFAKYGFGHENSNFAEFISGTSKDSLGAKLSEKGSHALDGQDKDTIDFLAQSVEDEYGNVGYPVMNGLLGEGNKNAESVAKQIISGYTATLDGNEREKFRDMLTAFRGASGYDTTQFGNVFGKAISAASLAKMDTKMIESLGGSEEARKILAKQIDELKQPANATLLTSMSPSMQEALGLQVENR